jgi:hypothetical protein
MRSPDLLPALHRTDRGRRAVGVSAIADGASAVAVGVVADRIHRSDRWRYRTGAAAVLVRSPPSPRYAHRVCNKVHRSTVRFRLYRIRELSCTSSMANGRRRCRQQVHVGQVHRIPYTAGTIGIDRQCWRRRGQYSGRVDHQMPMTLLTGGLRNRRLRYRRLEVGGSDCYDEVPATRNTIG